MTTAPEAGRATQGDRSVTLLETTLRDGAYAVNFQFTARDTARIASALERVGFEWIEVGHGLGLGGSRSGAGKAAETDRGYLRAAARALARARFGMFCIPGIATLDDVDMAAEEGMTFIRIGTEVTRVAESEPFIARAKRHGMFVSANFMKAHVCPPETVAAQARLSSQFGADLLCIADSAGGMLPEELRAYFAAVRQACDIPLGFHGHDNLGLAVSNTLGAIDAGAAMVDVCLQGIGRSAGNAASELVVTSLLKRGMVLPIDLLGLLDIGARHIRPLMTRRGVDSVDVISGYAGFHSSHMAVVRKYARRYRVDRRRLIVQLCARDRVNAPEALVRRLAQSLSREPLRKRGRFLFSRSLPRGKRGTSHFSRERGPSTRRRIG